MSRGWDNRICDKKALVKGLLLVGTMLLACKFTHSIAYAAFYPLVVMAFMSRKMDRALLCILLMASFLCANAYFVPKSAIYALLQRAGIILMGGCMFFSLLSRGVSPALMPLIGVLFYVGYMIIPSVLGWAMVVSLLKIFLFFATMMAWLGMSNIVVKGTNGNMPRLRSAMLAYACFMLIGSFLLLAVPQIGQMGMDDLTPDEIASRATLVSLFKGMTNHSQALGPVSAMTLVLVLGDYVFGVRKVHVLYNALIFCGVVILWKTSSRTAMVTFLFGAGVIFLTILKARLPNVRWKGKVKGAFVAVGFLMLTAVLLVPAARERALKFIVKYHVDDSRVLANVSMDDITSSRQGAFEKPLANWRHKPAIGNGFQVSEEMSYIKAKSIKELLTAPVEKGTWVVAVLEEGGVLGMVILCIWIITVYHLFTRRKLYIGRALFCTFLVANLGEFSMFSLSYVGSIEWVLIMTGVIMDNARLREVQPTSRFNYRFSNLAQHNF